MATCKGCAAPLIWAITENGKRMPLDAEPKDDGLFAVVEGQVGLFEDQPVAVHRSKAPADYDGSFHHSHHATCPVVERFR